MRIGYDGKRAALNNTGLGNYSRLLVEVLAREHPDNFHWLYTPRLQANPRLERLMRMENVAFRLPEGTPGKLRGALWRSRDITRLLWADRVELYHGLAGELPLNIARCEVPAVVTVHDLIFRHLPQTYSPIDRLIYDRKARQACRDARRIIAISEATKADIVDAYGTDPEKIDVVYQGCADQFRRQVPQAEIDEVRRRYDLPRPYIITVGTVETRKNQIMAVRGLRGVSQELDLLIVGRRTPYAQTIDKFVRTYALDERVKFVEHAAFADLPALYAGAFCSSYTSRCEGFGIPVIESLSVGTPVVVASGTCLEEAAGPDAPSVDPDDVDGWVSEIKELTEFPDRRATLAAKGRRWVRRFSDQAMAQGTMECYQKALGK